MAKRGEIDRALWLSPHDDAETLALFAKAVPTLLISSMSIANHITTGKPPREELNAYQAGKLNMFTVPGVYSIAPGFYLEDGSGLPNAEVISPGLHGETTDELLRPLGAPFIKANEHAFYAKPAMSVTPKHALAQVIAQWVKAPTQTLVPNVFTVFCSDGEYLRLQLRGYALGDDAGWPADKYSHIPHPRGEDGNQVCVEHAEVKRVMRAAYLKRQKTVE
jgi:hypothetical protein